MLEHLGSVLSGFGQESDRIRTQNQQQAEQGRQREQRALEILANADDPEIRSHAVTAMLTAHPEKGTGLDKWFGKQAEHPVFPIVDQLVGAGAKRAFRSPEEKAQLEVQTTGGKAYESEYGQLGGAMGQASEHGATPEQLRDMALSRFRAGPTPRGHQAITVKYQNPTGQIVTEAVQFDPNEGKYIRQDGTEITEPIVAASHSGKFDEPNAMRGAFFATEPDKASKTGYMKVHYTADNHEIGRVPTEYVPPPAASGMLQTPGGIMTQRRDGSVGLAPGGAGVGGAVPPTQSADFLRGNFDRINAQAKAASTFGGFPNQKMFTEKAEALARQMTGMSYADLTAAVGAAGADLAERTTPPPSTDAVKPAPGKKPAGKPGAGGMGLDPTKVREYNQKYGGGTP